MNTLKIDTDRTLEEITVNSLCAKLEQDIERYSNKAYDYNFIFEIKEGLVFCIGYSKIDIGNNVGGIYRMVCSSIGGTILYENGNVIDYDKMYSIDTVIQQTKGYFKHYSNKLELL